MIWTLTTPTNTKLLQPSRNWGFLSRYRKTTSLKPCMSCNNDGTVWPDGPHAWKEAHSHGNLWHLKDNHSQTKIAQKGYLTAIWVVHSDHVPNFTCMQFNLGTWRFKFKNAKFCVTSAIEIIISDIHHHVLEINTQLHSCAVAVLRPTPDRLPLPPFFQGFLLLILLLGSAHQNDVDNIVGRNLVRSKSIPQICH